MANATTSTTITFTTRSLSGGISVELDDVANNNKTSFNSGDTVHYLVHTQPLSMVVENITSAGTVAANGTKQVMIQETVTFAKEKTATLAKIPTGTVVWSWIGRDGGLPSFSGSAITLPADAVGVLKCSYPTTPKAFSLSGVTIPAGMDEFPVVVVVAEVTA